MLTTGPATYRLSFSIGSLFLDESLLLARSYQERSDWPYVAEQALQSLSFRTQSSARRTVREIIARLRSLHMDELEFFTRSSRHEQGHLLWLATCRTYGFVADFASEILQERYARFQEDLGYDHFDSFFDAKAEWHPELAELKPSTRAKLRQVLFRILREADLVSQSGKIMRTLLSPALQDLIIAHEPKELRFFPGASGLSA
ncbi:DUF1819 family protein [Mesorhizobium sp. M8A.F.Ca.ET.207.01.1.1]|uniref:DUF1819 family protein n=1 Tax=Mesorhizobium sp. M8A.F.Ca.ET.207.01.1.1 TaxID=2563968 RepID=UPI000FE58C61|nr:DUF1819 family protein [Mesorhizobium sp. M8A.F.Ca.ET.207.01.1.1]RWC29999.1 MAG: DUF1819 family protein [Mesorhizobium sp.]TGQ80138.1 DUF1819 family protein [Mesorhizobium sp. M8A.F.Ca.ET.207.01.1.1]